MPKRSKQRRTVVETRSTKRKTRSGASAIPFFEPSPKHCKIAKKSTVTPSPKASTSTKTQVVEKKPDESAVSRWLAYDKYLNGKGHFALDHDFLTNWSDLMDLPLFVSLQELLDDPLFQYIREKVLFTEKTNELRKWRQYAFKLSKYPTDVIKQVMEEYAKDMSMHKDVLSTCKEERHEKRFGGTRFYVRALNCIFFDSFERCHVPLPPQPKWDIKVEIGAERKYLYLKQLRAWDAYKRRVFEILKVVIANPTNDEGSVTVGGAVPLEHRGDMVPANESCDNEENCIPFIEIPIPDKERLTDQMGKSLGDRPACYCSDCEEGFADVLKRVEDARTDCTIRM